jgi:hypothetical protein
MNLLKRILREHAGKVAVAMFSICLCVPARAGSLTGDTVSLVWYFPTASTVYEVPVPPTETVGAGSPTFASSDWPFNTAVSVNVTGDQITFTDTYNGGGNFSSATFNGYVITDLTQSDIASVEVFSASSDWSVFSSDPSSVLSYTSDSISVNFENLPAGGSHIGDTLVLDVTTTPEPSPFSLVALGLMSLMTVAVRRRERA